MKTSIKAIISVIALGASAIALQAQPALKVGVLDLEKAINGYYKTAIEQEKLQAYQREANTNFEKLVGEGRALGQQLQGLIETINNPIINEAAKREAQTRGQALQADMQRKEQELNEYRQQAVRFLQQGAATTQQMLVGDIVNVATEVAKKKGLTMLINRNSALVFADPGYDITDDIVTELNKNKPATTPSVGLPK